MLIFEAAGVGVKSTHNLRAIKLVVAAALLLAATTTCTRTGPPAGAGPGAAGGAGAASGAPPRFDDGIPPPVGRPDEADGPALVNRPKLSDKAPRSSPDPRNLEGVWYNFGAAQSRIIRDMYGYRLSYTEAARKVLRHRREMDNAGTPLTNPSSRCYPAPTWNFEIDAPFHIVQTDDLIYFVFQEFHASWQIRMNQQHRTSGGRFFNGDSVGRWDGNTLVVDTINYEEPSWLDTAGTPASKDVRLIHRIRKLEDGKSLEVITTVNDPQMYATPWSFAKTFAWAPNAWMLGEYNCEQQVGDPESSKIYGLTEDK